VRDGDENLIAGVDVWGDTGWNTWTLLTEEIFNKIQGYLASQGGILEEKRHPITVNIPKEENVRNISGEPDIILATLKEKRLLNLKTIEIAYNSNEIATFLIISPHNSLKTLKCHGANDDFLLICKGTFPLEPLDLLRFDFTPKGINALASAP
jgi:predicted aspartyl protease